MRSKRYGHGIRFLRRAGRPPHVPPPREPCAAAVQRPPSTSAHCRPPALTHTGQLPHMGTGERVQTRVVPMLPVAPRTRRIPAARGMPWSRGRSIRRGTWHRTRALSFFFSSPATVHVCPHCHAGHRGGVVGGRGRARPRGCQFARSSDRTCRSLRAHAAVAAALRTKSES